MKLKVMIITMGLSRIVEPIINKYNVVGIVESSPRSKYGQNNTFIYKVIRSLYAFVKPQTLTLKGYLKKKNIPYYYMDRGCDMDFEIWVKDKKPDIIVVYSMSQLLKSNIFDIPKYKTINLHPALLPKYRGPNPDFWQYYNTEKKGGVTIHYIDKGEDTGDIIYQDEYDFPIGMKSPDMLDLSIGKIGVNLMLKALENVENLPSTTQEKESPTLKARNIKDDEHKNIIDWCNWDIERVWHILRGTELWLNSLEQPNGIYKGHRWIVEDYEKMKTNNYNIGEIYTENHQKFVVCSDGRIYLALKFSLKSFVLNIIR